MSQGTASRRHMTKEAALRMLEENKRWPKGTIRKEYLEQAEETINWYNALESETHGRQPD